MKLFISWSKDTSHAVALVLHDWLPLVVPSADPWVSSEDIAKGTRGRDAIVKELAGTGQGVICLTQQNVREPWINFEAGALSNHSPDPRVRTVLFDLKPSDVVGPLSDFQHTNLNDRDDVFKLVASINEASDQKISDRQLSTYFEKFWPDLVENLEKIREHQEQQPAGGDGAPQRDPEQLLEEVLERVRMMDSRQRMFSTRLARISKQFDHLADTLGLPPPPQPNVRRFVAMPPFGVGRVASASEDFLVVDLPDGRYKMPTGALRGRLRATRVEADQDYDRMKKEARNREVHGLPDEQFNYENVLEPIPVSRPNESEEISDDENGS